ncbi:MAG: hypothetical protein EON58_15155 [Alphaproteobacteria bacterium]|nr:MAG: hypothetical protein EON58_15155 [Alphaproteobacteria bacterium]
MTGKCCISYSTVGSVLLLGIATISLSGCQFRPDPLSAVSFSDNKDVVVKVSVRSADAKIIKQRELYFSLTVINCNGSGNGFPAQPSIGGELVPGFDFPIDGDVVQITGQVPAHIFAQYNEPCVLLKGGGYLTGTIKSSVVPIVGATRAGPNNSFKPNPHQDGA